MLRRNRQEIPFQESAMTTQFNESFSQFTHQFAAGQGAPERFVMCRIFGGLTVSPSSRRIDPIANTPVAKQSEIVTNTLTIVRRRRENL